MSTTSAPSTLSAGKNPEPSKRAPTSFLDPRALMRIQSLQLRAKVVVEGFAAGLHRSPYHGFSVEFSEYRQYSPGDDPRYLDWRLLARSDRYYIKRFEDETNLRCYLVVDLSRSMGYGAGAWTKADYARTLAATLAHFLTAQRDAVGLITFDERIAQYLPARHRPGHLRRLMLLLEHAVAGADTDLAEPLQQVARTVRKRGLVVLISDLLAPVETLVPQMRNLRSQGHDVCLLRVLDPAEIDFTLAEPTMIVDLESGRDLYIDPAVARREYLARFAEHDAAITRACNELGIDYTTLRTDRPLELALADFVRSRARNGSRAGGTRTQRSRRRT
jgi:uncharacterized protein (DUF58 family)